MNTEFFAEWLKSQGHKIYQSKSSYWYTAGPWTLQAFPFHHLINPDKNEIRSLLVNHRKLALRYSAPIGIPRGKISYHIVLDSCYDIEMLNKKVRNGIRKGLQYFNIEKIDFDKLSKEGWLLQQDTLRRQNRLDSMDKKSWERICHAAKVLPGFEAYGAMDQNSLAAAVIAGRVDDTFCIPYAMSHSRYLKNHVNNALFYHFSCELLKRENTSGIFYCVESLDAPENVDEFKLRMGFMAKPVKQVVEFHPVLKPLIGRKLHRFSSYLKSRYPCKTSLSKIEGIIRFYLEGRKSSDKQKIPHCLEKMEILQSSPA